MKNDAASIRCSVASSSLLFLFLLVLMGAAGQEDREPATALARSYGADIRPLLSRYCLGCHSEKAKKGDLDLERFTTLDAARKDVKPWQSMIEMLETGEMPPKQKPQPTADERRRLIAWVREFLDAEARARAGDPGRVGLRRLSNAEYDATIRELTKVDLRPAREFPADGAAGEGFTNASEALNMSPALLGKYLDAAREIASHAVLLPDGFRFSPSNTRRDWTDESVAELRKFYAAYASDEGRLPLRPYLAALLPHREELTAGKVTVADLARKGTLSAKYLAVLWKALSASDDPMPLRRLRSRFRSASAKDAEALAAEVAAWQGPLWTFQPIGSYRYGNVVRQVANDPKFTESQTLRTALKPAPGQSDVTLFLVSRDVSTDEGGGNAVWQRPRFERSNQPTLLLRDYARFGPRYELDYAALFADTPRYLSAAIEAANDRTLSIGALADTLKLDAVWLKRWIEVVGVEPLAKGGEPTEVGTPIPASPLELLGERATSTPTVTGWKTKGADLPIAIANSSNNVQQVPGRISPHQVAVHPTPAEFVAAAWTSPSAGRIRVAARVAHAHPACGNGVAWWLECRRGDQATVLAEGTLALGKDTTVGPKSLTVAQGDLVMLAVDARGGDHSCDLTEIALTLSEPEGPRRKWDLARDVADNVGEGNPHADSLGNKGVWRFVKGPSRSVSGESFPSIPAESILGRWREAASDLERQGAAVALAETLRGLLTGPRPADEKAPDRRLYDALAALDGPLLRGIDLARLGKPRSQETRYGLDAARFSGPPNGGPGAAANVVSPIGRVVELRLPAALFRDYEFVVDAALDRDAGARVVQFAVQPASPLAEAFWDGKSPLVAATEGRARGRLLDGFAEFRRIFPAFLCFPRVIPVDEVVCLKTFHREDEPLNRLFLDDAQTRRIDRLWAEHRFISKFPVVENEYLPLFIGFVTQDQPKELLAYFESQREPFRLRARQFEDEFEAAAPGQLQALVRFAAEAYRRPLSTSENDELRGLYHVLRGRKASHEEAFRGVLERILVSPSFLYHLEQPPPGNEPRPVNDWELAARLSYFLWSAPPDDLLRQAAAEGRLHEPAVLAAETRRMLKDERTRALAIEFGTQWIHVRGFDELKEKNERLFPTFDEGLRRSIYEESIRFFQDLFQNDRAVTQLLDADYTFLDETLARHYGIAGVAGPAWRRVEGVRKYGRGGLLGLASVLSKEAGASRTSPVLRGNWVVETLLGERLPRPPANVPRLPEEEAGNDGLTMRQLVEKHVRAPECAVCHERIDPFGFALERYDPIGRFRDKDLGGLPVDATSTLRDGSEFEGIDGLRTYLLTEKRDVFLRIVCRRLLGYALGREVALSDRPLIDAMMATIARGDGRVSSLVLTIVASPQFRSIRGASFAANE